MPYIYGAAAAQENLIAELDDVFHAVAEKHELAAGDLPDVAGYRRALASLSHHHGPACFTEFDALDQAEISVLDEMIKSALPALRRHGDHEAADAVFDALDLSVASRGGGLWRCLCH